MYKEKLTESGRYKDLFALFNKMLEEKEIITRKGSIVDATIVQRPQQRYNKEQKAREKKGEAEGFEEKNPHRKSQTDTDAKYGVKHGKCYFGYKNHIKMDKDSKIITAIEVTDAATGDGKMIVGMVDEKDEVLYADSAYRGKNIEEEILNKNEKIELMICEKAEKNHPLTEEQKANNTKKAKIRCRVEHVFGHIVKSMGGKLVRRVGIVRTRCEIYLKNLAYNLSRWTFLSRQRDKSTQTG
jgi:IS5 family transposase